MESHNIMICNDKTVNIVQLPPAQPPEANAIETFARLTTINSNTIVDQDNNNTNRSPPPNSIPSPNQSSIILHQFSLLKEEIRNFIKLVLNNISEMTQVHKTAEEQTSKTIENAISQVLTKTHDTTTSTLTTLNASNQNVTYASPPYNVHQTPTWHTTYPNIPHTPHVNTNPTYRHQELHKNTQPDSHEQEIYQAPTDLNQSVVDLIRHQKI